MRADVNHVKYKIFFENFITALFFYRRDKIMCQYCVSSYFVRAPSFAIKRLYFFETYLLSSFILLLKTSYFILVQKTSS